MRKHKQLYFWNILISLIFLPAIAICTFVILMGFGFSLFTAFSPFLYYIIYLFIFNQTDKYLEANFGKYISLYCPAYTKMKFSNWVDIFNLNPNRWSFPEMVLEDYDTRVIAVKYENDKKIIFIYFDFLDWLRFKHWYKYTYRSQIKFKQEQIQNKEEVKILEIILQNAQNDIDRLRAQSEKEFNQGTKIIKEAIRYGN